jgi:OmpA family/PEGA domain
MAYKKCMFVLAILLVFSPLICIAQDAQVRVQVKPPEAYVFLDGVAIGRDNRTLTMTPGKHTIGVYNYGFKPMIKDIDAAAGQNETIQAFLEPDERGAVSGPWGVLQIEGAKNAAVLLNGKTPDFFVGHGDMTNHHIWFKQQLILPVGTYDVNVTERGKELFSGPVTVNRNERVLLYVDQGGKRVVKSWSEGTDMNQQKRFKAGRATTTVAVAPVSGTISAMPTAINCNDTVAISWKTDETLHAYLTVEPYVLPDSQWDLKVKRDLPPSSTEEVPLTGSKQFQPKVSTKYSLRSPGPGGVVLQSVLVPVNPVVQARMRATDEPAHFVRIGDKILAQDSTTFNWTVDNADTITIDEIGNVQANPAKETVGEATFKPSPKLTQTGVVDEKQVFKLNASNVCGGSDVATATVHVVGDTEPNMASVFFPTAYPNLEHPSIGLLHSQEMQLVPIARAFKLYMEHTPDAKLVLIGNADSRSSSASNLNLSRRRANDVRRFLLDMGVPNDRIETQADGSNKLLDAATVKLLEAQNPTPDQIRHISVGATPHGEQGDAERTTNLAYNRRVDIIILPAAVESAKYYPHSADGSAIMRNRGLEPNTLVEAKQW